MPDARSLPGLKEAGCARPEVPGAALFLLLVTHASICGNARAQDQLRLSGFATLRGSTPADGPLDQDDAVGRIQLGLGGG